MRFLPLLLLTACFDGATTRITLDLKGGSAHVVQQLHNAWPAEVGCEGEGGAPVTVEACVVGARARLEKGRDALVEGGATVTRAGIVLADGELDLLYEYTAPVGAPTLKDQGLTLLWMDERTPSQVAKGKEGKRRVALIALAGGENQNRISVEGRYRRLRGAAAGETLDVWLFQGKSAAVVSEWTYQPEGGSPGSPGPWLAERPGLVEALEGSGLVIAP